MWDVVKQESTLDALQKQKALTTSKTRTKSCEGQEGAVVAGGLWQKAGMATSGKSPFARCFGVVKGRKSAPPIRRQKPRKGVYDRLRDRSWTGTQGRGTTASTQHCWGRCQCQSKHFGRANFPKHFCPSSPSPPSHPLATTQKAQSGRASPLPLASAASFQMAAKDQRGRPDEIWSWARGFPSHREFGLAKAK